LLPHDTNGPLLAWWEVSAVFATVIERILFSYWIMWHQASENH